MFALIAVIVFAVAFVLKLMGVGMDPWPFAFAGLACISVHLMLSGWLMRRP